MNKSTLKSTLLPILTAAIFAVAAIPAVAQQQGAQGAQGAQGGQQGAKKKQGSTVRSEVDKSVQSGTVPAKYRSNVPKEYQQYVPFAKPGQ